MLKRFDVSVSLSIPTLYANKLLITIIQTMECPLLMLYLQPQREYGKRSRHC